MKDVKQIISEQFVALREDEPISKAIAEFEERKPAAIVVFSENGEYKGVLSERWIYRTKTDPRKTKVGGLTRYVPAASEDTSLAEIARWMFEHHVQVVPVFRATAASANEKDLIGIVSDISLLSAVVEENAFGNQRVCEYATTEVIYLNPDDSVAKALAVFRENAISRAPVVERGKVVGIITMHDIVTKFLMPRERATFGEMSGEKVRPLSMPVRSVMSYPVVWVPPDGRVRDAVAVMKERDISGVPLIEQGKCRGIITKRDLLEAFVKFMSVAEESGRRGIQVQFAGDYSSIDEFQMSHIRSDIEGLAEKLSKMFDEGLLVVHFKRIKSAEEGIEGSAESYSAEHFNIRMRFFAPGAVFSAHEEGFGALDVFERVKDKIERGIFEEKVRARDTIRKERQREGKREA